MQRTTFIQNSSLNILTYLIDGNARLQLHRIELLNNCSEDTLFHVRYYLLFGVSLLIALVLFDYVDLLPAYALLSTVDQPTPLILLFQSPEF